MHWRDLNLRPNTTVLRQFGGLLAVFGVGMAGWQWFAYHRVEAALCCAAAAGLVALLAFLRPQALRPVFVVSVVMTFPIGWGVSQFVLLAMFYLVITPLALIFRLLGRDVLDVRTPTDHRSTFWLEKKTGSRQDSYFSQF